MSSVSEYYFSRKLKEVAQMNAQGMDVISLGIGSPDMPPSEQTIRTLCEAAQNPDGHGYMPYVGIPELRSAFAAWYKRWYGVELNPKTEIQPLIGSKEGILHVTLAFVNPGEQVLVPNPGYPTYTSLSKILGAEVVNYNLREDNGWMPDWEQLEAMDTSRVKLMWTNYPNMPTGAPATPELYERLVDFARRRGIIIVNDNPYSFILNDHPLSILSVPGAKDCCIEFNSMSKSHNMPGWRQRYVPRHAAGCRHCPRRRCRLVRRQQLQLPQPPPTGRRNHAHTGLYLRRTSGRHVPLGTHPQLVQGRGRADRTCAARGPCLHHPRLHLRLERCTLHPHLALLQGCQTGGSIGENKDNEE